MALRIFLRFLHTFLLDVKYARIPLEIPAASAPEVFDMIFFQKFPLCFFKGILWDSQRNCRYFLKDSFYPYSENFCWDSSSYSCPEYLQKCSNISNIHSQVYLLRFYLGRISCKISTHKFLLWFLQEFFKDSFEVSVSDFPRYLFRCSAGAVILTKNFARITF